MTTLKHRYDFVYLFDVMNGNPNGDPDAGNAPRIDPETGYGLISDVCLKRKIRNFICLAKGVAENNPAEGYDIYVKEKSILNNQHERAYTDLKLDSKQKGKDAEGHVDQARAWMCKTFFDVRMFGAVMSTGVNCGQVRGPVQFAFANSVDMIVPLEQSITRMAVTTEAEAESQQKIQADQARTMGRKTIIPYAMYEAHGFISPQLAAQTKFSEEDLAMLKQSLAMMFEHDRSAARGQMSAIRCIAFKHESALGNAPAHRLFERVQVKRKDPAKPVRSASDYEITINRENLPSGISIEEWV